MVAVPEKAQYETGFAHWVKSVGNLTRQLGCRVIFCCTAETRRYISAVLRAGHYEIRSEYRTFESWDDFILLANKIVDDDLFVVVSARRASVSFTSDLEALPEFLRKYFSQNNLMVIFPEQFGEEVAVTGLGDALAPNVEAEPMTIWLRLISGYRRWAARKAHRKRSLEEDEFNL